MTCNMKEHVFKGGLKICHRSDFSVFCSYSINYIVECFFTVNDYM